MASVASTFPHFGEEDVLRGSRGSGTIFFSQCNLHCVFCQNFDTSHGGEGFEQSPEQLAERMLALQLAGCHNVNLVTPSHIVPQILEALLIAVGDGLRIPIVYNTSAFDSVDTLRELDGVIDVYMPDFKLWTGQAAERYLGSPEYPEVARAAIREMHRQVGDLVVDQDGLATRGLLVRHLVMPGLPDESRGILRFLADEISTDTYVNLMGQYHPEGFVGGGRFVEIDRGLQENELAGAYRMAAEAGLHRFDRAAPGAAEL